MYRFFTISRMDLVASDMEFLSLRRIMAFGIDEGFILIVFSSNDEYATPLLSVLSY